VDASKFPCGNFSGVHRRFLQTEAISPTHPVGLVLEVPGLLYLLPALLSPDSFTHPEYPCGRSLIFGTSGYLPVTSMTSEVLIQSSFDPGSLVSSFHQMVN
jgi:hypothetical protein